MAKKPKPHRIAEACMPATPLPLDGAEVIELPRASKRAQEDAVIAEAMEILDRRLSREGLETLSDPAAAGRAIRARIAERPNEVFVAMFLDCRHRLIAMEELFHGTIDGAEIHPRVIVQRALFHNAGAIIVGHNHPSGEAGPSAADRVITARLKQALALVDIRLLDHFVVGFGPPVSLAARGWV